MPQVELIQVPPHHADLKALIARLDEYLFKLYPPEEVFTVDFNDPYVHEIQFIVAYTQGKAVGCGAIKKVDESSVEIKRFFVDESCRNQGVAGLILGELERRARAQSFTSMKLETGADQVEAVRFYEKHGFVPIEPYGEYIGCPSSLCYEKRLTDKGDLIQAAEVFVKKELEHEPSGHDWWHIERVRRLAVLLADRAGADPFICELAALLHDIADEKLNESKEAGLDKVRGWLSDQGAAEDVKQKVLSIISTMSFNGGKNPPMDTLEGKVVQDADRLDAIGAIGIARTFVYSGAKGRPIHLPGQDFSGTDYRSSDKSAIYHFYEKLLKLKDLLNTAHAKKLAEERHQFMEQFLIQFYKEWDLTEERK